MNRQHRPDPPPSRRPAAKPGPLVVNLPAAKADTAHGTAPGPAGEAPDLRLPHERDQSAVDTAAAAPDPLIAQAAKDLASGQVDTDLHNTPGLDAKQRERLLRRGR